MIEQTYTSTPERQLMRAACAREDRAHKQLRSRVATTGRNTLKREFARDDDPCVDLSGGEVEPGTVKRLCGLAGSSKLAAPEWRVKE